MRLQEAQVAAGADLSESLLGVMRSGWLVLLTLLVWLCGHGEGGLVVSFSSESNKAPLHNLAYRAEIDAWLFLDSPPLSSAYTFLLAQVCVHTEHPQCERAPLHVMGTCEQVRALLDDRSWEQVYVENGVCNAVGGPNTSAMTTLLRVQQPSGLVIANNVQALARYDMAPNTTDNVLHLHVRFLYLTLLDAGRLIDIRTSSHDLHIAPLKSTVAVIHVQTECSARGLTSPRAGQPPSAGGSTMQVLVNAMHERFCVWQCAHGFYKYPWNAQAYLRGEGGNVTSACQPMATAFTALRATFVLASRLNSYSPQAVSLSFLADLDAMAESASHMLEDRIAGAVLLFSLRGSLYNTLSHDKFLQRFADAPNREYEVLNNQHFTQARRLLQGTQAHDLLVDVLAIAPSVSLRPDTLSAEVIQTVEAINVSTLPVSLFVTGVYDADVHSVHRFVQHTPPSPPPSPPAPPPPPAFSPPAFFPTLSTETTDSGLVLALVAVLGVGVVLFLFAGARSHH